MPRPKNPDRMTAEDDARLGADMETIRRGHDAETQATKQAIAKWAEDHERTENGGTMTLALLELGIKRPP